MPSGALRLALVLLACALSAPALRAQDATAAPGTEAPAGEPAAPDPTGPPATDPRVFVLHKELPKGVANPALAGREPLYEPGEPVRFGVFRPGGDDQNIDVVEVKVDTPYTASAGLTIPLTETNAASNTYLGSVQAERLAAPGPTRSKGFAVLLADPSAAGAEWARLGVQRGQGLPDESLGVLKVPAEMSYAPPARAWLEAGGAEQGTVTYGTLSQPFLVARCANWLYVSGRYSPAGGLVSLGELAPRDILGTKWRESLELLVLACSYAADVNDVCERAPFSPMRGMHGPEWWRKFGRTLAGYSGAAPGGEAEAQIARRFLKLAREGPPSEPSARSRHLVHAWLRANQAQLVVGAVGIDDTGTYHHQPKPRALTLRGAPFTLSAVAPWTTEARALWEAKGATLRGDALLMSWTDFLLEELSKQRAGAVPLLKEVVTDAGIDWVLGAARQDAKEKAWRERAKVVMGKRHTLALDRRRGGFAQQGTGNRERGTGNR